MNIKKLERYSPVNLLGSGPRLIKKKNLPGRDLTKVEKHCNSSRFNAGSQTGYLSEGGLWVY